MEAATEWMGHRPALPRHRADHLGVGEDARPVLTTAATTERLMGQLIACERPEIDLHPYRINRF